MGREVLTINEDIKPAILSLECPQCGGRLTFVKGDHYQCSYCDTYAKLINGEFVKEADEEFTQGIKKELTEESLQSIIDALNDGTRETQTIVSVDKKSKKKPSIFNILFIDLCVTILYIEIVGLGTIKGAIYVALIAILNGYMMACRCMSQGNRNEDDNSQNNIESTDTEVLVKKNGRMHI